MKNKKRNFFIAVMIVVVVLYGVCVINVNKKYPETKEKILLLNQSFEYQNVEISVTDFWIMSEEDKQEYYGPEINHYGDCVGLNVRIIIENNTNREQKVDITPLIFESGAWKNAIHYLAFTKLNAGNEKMSFNPRLGPGERMELILSTFAAPIHMREKQWMDFLEREMYLVCSLYPEKVMVKLH